MPRRPRTALYGAAACLLGLAVTGVVAHLLPWGRTLDSRALDAFTRVRASGADGFLQRLVHLGDPLPYLLLAVAVLVAAGVRERPRLGAILAAVLVVAPLTAELLKLATAQARAHSAHAALHIADASWPSGHATGAMTLALCAALVAPPRLRPAVALAGALFAVAMGYAVIALVWHFPSDVIGAFLLSCGWAMVAVAASRRWPDRATASARSPAAATVATLAVAAIVGALAWSSYRPGSVLDAATDHPVLAVAAGAIAALAALLAGVVVRSTAAGD